MGRKRLAIVEALAAAAFLAVAAAMLLVTYMLLCKYVPEGCREEAVVEGFRLAFYALQWLLIMVILYVIISVVFDDDPCKGEDGECRAG